MDKIQDIINKLSWTEAKTMKNIPHEYTVRNKSLNTEYETLYNYIYDNHYIEIFYGKPYKYVIIGDFKYWIMTDDITQSVVINRCKIGDKK